MHLPFILATALLQEGSGEATKSLGFLIVILLGAPAAWLLFSGKNVPLGVALGIVALIVLWHMAQLPLETNVLFMTVMATKMPLVGRG